jgi:hypothetical protein
MYRAFLMGYFLMQCETPESRFYKALRIVGRNPGIEANVGIWGGTRHVPENHQAHKLARLLSRRTDSMLLTTATPHNGKRETFGRLISLLDPAAIPDPIYREYDADDIRGFYLMRFKEDVRHEINSQLTQRIVIPLSETTSQATESEEAVYSCYRRFPRVLLEFPIGILGRILQLTQRF